MRCVHIASPVGRFGKHRRCRVKPSVNDIIADAKRRATSNRGPRYRWSSGPDKDMIK